MELNEIDYEFIYRKHPSFDNLEDQEKQRIIDDIKLQKERIYPGLTRGVLQTIPDRVYEVVAEHDEDWDELNEREQELYFATDRGVDIDYIEFLAFRNIGLTDEDLEAIITDVPSWNIMPVNSRIYEVEKRVKKI